MLSGSRPKCVWVGFFAPERDFTPKLEPENILFDLDEQPHLTDYGLFHPRPVDVTGMVHLIDENLAYLSQSRFRPPERQ